MKISSNYNSQIKRHKHYHFTIEQIFHRVLSYWCFPPREFDHFFPTRQRESRKSAEKMFPPHDFPIVSLRQGDTIGGMVSLCPSCHDQRSIFSRRMMRPLAWPVGKSSINRRNSTTRERETRLCHLQSRPQASLPILEHTHHIKRLWHRNFPRLECSSFRGCMLFSKCSVTVGSTKRDNFLFLN